MYTLCSLELPALESDAFVVASNIDKKMSTDGKRVIPFCSSNVDMSTRCEWVPGARIDPEFEVRPQVRASTPQGGREHDE